MTSIRLGRIIITPSTIVEHEGAPLVTLQREDVRRVRLVHGRIAEHPLMLIGVGIGCAIAGIAGIVLLATFKYPRIGALCALLLLAAPAAVLAALRQGPVLHVETTRGTRRLGFGKGVRPEALPEFVEAAKTATGLEIEVAKHGDEA